MQKRETELQQLVAGTQKNLPATSTVDVNGQELKQTDIVATLQGWIPLFQQADATYATYLSAQKALGAAAPAIRQYVGLYRLALRQVFGKGSPLLADFGLNVTQSKTQTPATHVLASAKAAATRKARNTLGKQQRKTVKGAPVTQVTVAADGTQSESTVGSGNPGPAK